MKSKLILSGILAGTLLSNSALASPVDLSSIKPLGGKQGDACGALLCLAGGMMSGECASYVAKYFAIQLSKPWKTAQARRDFLNLCPTASIEGYDDKEFNQWQNNILPNIDGACTKEELNRDEKSQKPLRTIETKDNNGNTKIINIWGYRINPNPTNSCNLLMSHNYFSKKISYTCSKQFYEEEDWFNGYIKEEVSKSVYEGLSEDLRGTEKRKIKVSYQEWVKLPNDERDSQKISGSDKDFYVYYKLEDVYFKKNLIKKDCWLVEDKVVVK
ncbi:TrbM/KikA/MpfK family conjugal transfer protein [Campylobacter helveticus]|uniref:TrbM/KikA/MpfK family conjugal transfer protein n=1 Tax=Campylobacter helveticus TaxID=28898 RepID=UPI0029429943|nr:TrbM/KikA/MpfK family conjugal transfer protein [Campylobacter helveticus]